jgi:N6-adenosine-specific RNA methylase IME4
MKNDTDARFTRIASNLLLGVRDLADWGIDTGVTTPDELRISVLRHDPVLRKQAAEKLLESGMSQRAVAKVLGVTHTTIQNDVANNLPESGKKVATPAEPTEAALPENPAESAGHPPASGLTPAERREAALREQLRIAQTPAVVPNRQYGTIVIDPPWPMRKIEREVRPNQVEFDYPTMDYEQLRAFRPTFQRLAADSCHVFMWTTQRFLPMALRLFEDYEVKYVLTMVWHKPGGFQPVGLPQYNCEFVLYGRIGVPEFTDTTAFNCCFEAPRTEHSRKPDAFYDLVRRVTAGERVDVFSRETREGFDQLGNEVNRFDGGEHIRDRSGGRAKANAADNIIVENAIPISRIGKRAP